MKPENFAEENDLEFKGSKMVKGVEFAVFEQGKESVKQYHLLYPGGCIDLRPLMEVFSRGNYTVGRTSNGREFMADDEGLHLKW